MLCDLEIRYARSTGAAIAYQVVGDESAATSRLTGLLPLFGV